jgi:hypothetical protein
VARDADIAKPEGLEQFKTAYEQAYRLGPDARVLLALADVESVLSGKPRSPVEARFKDGQWLLQANGAELGTLPELPDFPQALAMVEARVQKLGLQPLELQAGGGTSEVPPLPLGRQALESLHALNRKWADGKHSASELRVGARALASLAFQTVDLTGTADEVSSRALSLLAMARVATGEPLTEEQALLAASLGYERAARELAKTLPEDSLVRVYFAKDDARLEALVKREKVPGLAHYLWVRRIGEVDETERSRRLKALRPVSVPGIHEVTARLRAGDFDTDEYWGTAASVLVLREVAAAANPGEAERVAPRRASKRPFEALEKELKKNVERFSVLTRGILPPFEEQLERVGSQSGFFLDTATERAWFQGLFYSALYRQHLHNLDRLSSTEAAAAFSSALGTPSSPAGKEYQDWMGRLIAARSGERVEASLMEALLGLKSFGAAPLVRVFEELEEAADWGDPALSSMTRRLASRLDSRPGHRRTLASIAYDSLLDMGLSEKLYRAELEATGSPWVAAWVARLDGDVAKLQALDSPESTGRIRLRAFSFLLESQAKVDPAEVMARLQPLIQEYGAEWAFVSRCIELLEEHELYAQARGVAEGWLARNPKATSFEKLFARTAMARMYQHEGNPEAAWKLVEPLVESYQFGAMQRGALLLQELGREAEALELAERAARRYPGPKSLALVAEVLWRSGKEEQAAQALARPTRSIRSLDWRFKLGPAFAAVYANRPAADGLRAFTAMKKAGLGVTELGQLAASVGGEGNHELAFEMKSRLTPPGLQRLEVLMEAYGHLKKWKSEEAAVAWVRAQVPKQLLQPLSMFAFRAKSLPVLWDVIPSPEGTSEHEDYVWLMRAALSTRLHDADAAHQEALRKRFETDRPSFYHQAGRYLLGLTSESAVLAAASTPKSRQEVTYFLGLKAQADGRFADATTWYRATVETSTPRQGEYRWAYDDLYRFRSAGVSLARLKESML